MQEPPAEFMDVAAVPAEVRSWAFLFADPRCAETRRSRPDSLLLTSVGCPAETVQLDNGSPLSATRASAQRLFLRLRDEGQIAVLPCWELVGQLR